VIYNSSLSVRHHQDVGIRSRADVMIPNGFDLARYRPAPDRRKAMRERLGIGEEPLVGLVARVHPMKDHAGFVAAASQIAQAIPGVRFVLAGEGTDGPEIRALLEAQGIAGQTICMGRVTHTEDLYPALDLFVLSSAWGEGWPNVIGEAMACGVVAVGTDVGETANVIGDTARVVEASNPQALAAACIKVLNMPDESRHALGRRAHERIMSHFDINAVFKQYAQAWDDVV
jgi:glycosyltransferase involved in cell wall biosynthesis